MAEAPDHYATLGVAPDSEDVVIRAAYRALMHKYHPDKFAGDPAFGDRKAREINEAYAVLSDADKRASYDRSRRSSGRAERSSNNSSNAKPDGAKPSAAGGGSGPDASAAAEDADSSPSPGPIAVTPVGGSPLFVIVVVIVALVGFGAWLASNGHVTQASASAESSSPLSSSDSSTPAPDAKVGDMVSWDAKHDGDPKTYLVGGYTLTLSSKPGGDEPLPVLQVKAPTGEVFTQVGQPGLETANATFGVGRFDTAATGNQIIFTTFSGGAHCCADVTILELTAGAWKAVDVASFQGGTWTDFPSDVDNDGVADIVGPDGRFAYAFTDFADSQMPPQIYNVVRGRAVDVSSSKRYAKLFRSDMQTARTGCAQHNNGACAAFVADASRLGLHDWAWGEMLSNYDPNHSWQYPAHCLIAAVEADCPQADQQTSSTFPEALAAFLQDSGYTFAPNAPAPVAANPSFDCGRVQSDVLRLVCNTPDLAAADRDLALAYNAALSQSADPHQLQLEQRAWIFRRNDLPASVDVLRRTYQARIGELRQAANLN